MAQGAVKKSVKPAKPSKKKSQALGPKKHGNRVIAPKKAKAVQANKIMKKHSAGLTALTEKKLAERAGHVELLKGGKKDKGNTSKGKK